MTDVIMPQMGESIAEGTVTKWMKNVGDRVQRDEPLFEISTDKVDAEIPAPATGVLKEIRVQPGATVPINTVVAVIAAEGEAVVAPAPPAPAPPPAAPPAGSVARPAPPDAPPAPPVNFVLEPEQAPRPVRPRSEMTAAEHMVLSKRTSAHVATVFEVDMTRVDQLRNQYRPAYEQRSGVRLTYLPFILKATIDALKAFPVLNASIDGDSIVYHKDVNVGLAVALDWGLIVPVIHRADEKNLLGLARAVNDLADRARAKKLRVDEVQGGTFTITNPGVFGSLFGTPIINQPQVAILGVGTIEKRPVVRDDAIAIRTMAYLALSFDHRLVDGADADRFMAHLKQGLQEFDEKAL